MKNSGLCKNWEENFLYKISNNTKYSTLYVYYIIELFDQKLYLEKVFLTIFLVISGRILNLIHFNKIELIILLKLLS